METNIKDFAADMADMHASGGDDVSLDFIRPGIVDADALTNALEKLDLVCRPCGNVMPDGWVLVAADDAAIDEHLARGPRLSDVEVANV